MRTMIVQPAYWLSQAVPWSEDGSCSSMSPRMGPLLLCKEEETMKARSSNCIHEAAEGHHHRCTESDMACIHSHDDLNDAAI